MLLPEGFSGGVTCFGSQAADAEDQLSLTYDTLGQCPVAGTQLLSDVMGFTVPTGDEAWLVLLAWCGVMGTALYVLAWFRLSRKSGSR